MQRQSNNIEEITHILEFCGLRKELITRVQDNGFKTFIELIKCEKEDFKELGFYYKEYANI